MKSSPSILHYVVSVKSTVKISSIFVAFLENMNFNTSHLEAHTGFFRLLIKGIFNPYVLWPFDKKLIS